MDQITQAQVAHGAQVTVITDQRTPGLPLHEAHWGVEVHRVPMQDALRERNPSAILEVTEPIERIISAFLPEVIHLHANGPSVWIYLLSRSARDILFILTLHTPFSHLPFSLSFFDRLVSRASWISAVSDSLLQDFIARHPESADRSSRIWNGLPAPNSPPMSPSPPPHPVVMAVGRLVPEKGFDFAISLFASGQPLCPSARLLIVGDGPDFASLNKFAADQLKPGSYEFTESVAPEEVPPLMAEVSLVVIPSLWAEPFGLVALQAAQAGVPVLASDTGGLAERVVSGTSGQLLPPGDLTTWHDALLYALQHPKKTRRMGDSAREFVNERFGFEQCVGRYREVYLRITGRA
ncbi:MAG: glycosyltransferase family 4 protein [Candidatus Synoicihabitans palmerolidicus]|nr:glycosyltransferase family 4 protein [Candidatus Synoicihabitans palmerolidicus]